MKPVSELLKKREGTLWHVRPDDTVFSALQLLAQHEVGALVVMDGTAVTVDALDASGRFLGGLILPGFGMMLRALEMGTAGLKVPTGEVVDFPTNTSDALMSGGANAIAGAIERQYRKLLDRTGQEPMLFITGGAAVKLTPITDLPFETVDTLIFEGLLLIQSRRLGLAQNPPPA